jgi:UDPglucose 6-dehydrogenase
MTFKIAIVGHGFVGTAVDHGFPNEKCSAKFIVDPKYPDAPKIKDLPWDLTAAFVCVPTPVGVHGEVDASIIDRVVAEFVKRYGPDGRPLLVVKSTVTADHLQRWSHQYDRLVFNPEFLTEKNAIADFINPRFTVIGGCNQGACYELKYVYNLHSACSHAPFFVTDLTTASLVKYTINSFLATKVTFFNQIHELCHLSGADWHTLRTIVGDDERVGHSHTMVPGPDGRLGFGGACFPKDTLALVDYAARNNMSLSLVNEAVWHNTPIRASYEIDEREAANNIKFRESA